MLVGRLSSPFFRTGTLNGGILFLVPGLYGGTAILSPHGESINTILLRTIIMLLQLGPY